MLLASVSLAELYPPMPCPLPSIPFSGQLLDVILVGHVGIIAPMGCGVLCKLMEMHPASRCVQRLVYSPLITRNPG